MKRLVFLFGILLLGISTAGNAAIYRFDQEGNEHEAGYLLFDSDNHSSANPAHDGEAGPTPPPFPPLDMPSGLQISASNGGGLPAVPFGTQATSNTPYYAYMDGNWKQDAGLGVCQSDTNSCGSDDNQMEGEFIHMVFDTVVEILTLDITGNHEAVAQGTEFWYSLDGGNNWSKEDISGQIIGAALDLNVSWITDTLDYTIKAGPNNGEMYLSAMEVSPIPVPAAFWLFGTALIGFISYSRRTRL